MRIFEHANYKFLERRGYSYAFSALLGLVTIGAIVFNVVSTGSWMNYGVDFTGGSLVQVRFMEPITDAELREALGGASAPDIARFGEANLHEFVIRAPLEEGASITEVAENIEQQIQAELAGRQFEIVRTELVGAKVGSELQERAALAILICFVGTLIYLAFRFELRFGLAAVIATVHDIVLTLGFLALTRFEISLSTVAAVLTILGYSLNDKIVVFDRIRENLNMKGARKRDPLELLNRSINETLPRTVLTGGATLGVLIILSVLAGVVIREFALTMFFGIVVGTYSSIFIATPALIEIQKRFGVGKTGQQKKREEPATV